MKMGIYLYSFLIFPSPQQGRIKSLNLLPLEGGGLRWE